MGGWGACGCGVGSFACGVGSAAAGDGRGATWVGVGIPGRAAPGGCGAGFTAAVGAEIDGAGVGDGAGWTTPLGASAVLGRYTHATVTPRTASGTPINNAINGTTRRFVSPSVGLAASGTGSLGGVSGGGWITCPAAVGAEWNCECSTFGLSAVAMPCEDAMPCEADVSSKSRVTLFFSQAGAGMSNGAAPSRACGLTDRRRSLSHAAHDSI